MPDKLYLRNYARIVLYLLGMRHKVRPLYIRCDGVSEQQQLFARGLVEEAYKMGVPQVDVLYFDIGTRIVQLRHAPAENKFFIPEYVTARSHEMVSKDVAHLVIDAGMDMAMPQSVASLAAQWRGKMFQADKPHYERRHGALQPWLIVAVPSPVWAKAIGTSVEALWKAIFAITGADRRDPIAYVDKVLKKLQRRREMLNSMRIQKLRFTGSGTDLIVGLSSKARWMGGLREAEDGTPFCGNWPQFENFTTPDWRTVEGTVSITKPAYLSGAVVEELRLDFEGGRIVRVRAARGRKTYQALIGADVGAAQLGEVALVGVDSPVHQSHILFRETLFDENAACHIATGNGMPFCLEGGNAMSKEEQEALGLNTSRSHDDVMISDEYTNVVAYRENGNAHELLKQGKWVGALA